MYETLNRFHPRTVAGNAEGVFLSVIPSATKVPREAFCLVLSAEGVPHKITPSAKNKGGREGGKAVGRGRAQSRLVVTDKWKSISSSV